VAAAIIPVTWRETALRSRRAGDRVNLECDILAKYVEKLLGARPDTRPALRSTAAGVGILMRKVFHFDSPREKYHCDAAIVWWFRQPFRAGLPQVPQAHRRGQLRSIKVAGGAKCLASPERETEREFVLEQIRKSMRLHGTNRVILMLHTDCGGYGGLAAFGGDPRAEAEQLVREIALAAATLGRRSPESASRLLRGLRGVWDAEVDGPGDGPPEANIPPLSGSVLRGSRPRRGARSRGLPGES